MDQKGPCHDPCQLSPCSVFHIYVCIKMYERNCRVLCSLGAVATETAWPTRSSRSSGAVTAGTARTARSSRSLGADGALLSLLWRGGDGDGVSWRAPSAPAARQRRSPCSPGKGGGRRERQVRGQGGGEEEAQQKMEGGNRR